ncbi:MAG: hypothetical protein U9N63_13920 [Pseudomonadota bacterium]|nr:hypothetical protein [Pseudomonadota bacterium]
MSEVKADKKVENSGTVSQKGGPKKQNGKAFSFVAIIIAGLLVLAVISVFLNNQKLNKQIVDLDRQFAALQEGEKALGNRVLALEDELVVLSLKRRLVQVKKSVKNLQNVQGFMADNQELVVKVQGLIDELGGEEKKLAQEIAGSTPKVFQPSRSCPQPCYQRCSEPVVIMHPPIPQAKGASPALTQAASAHATAHAAPKAKTLATGADPDSWWSKFIHLRLFGN